MRDLLTADTTAFIHKGKAQQWSGKAPQSRYYLQAPLNHCCMQIFVHMHYEESVAQVPEFWFVSIQARYRGARQALVVKSKALAPISAFPLSQRGFSSGDHQGQRDFAHCFQGSHTTTKISKTGTSNQESKSIPSKQLEYKCCSHIKFWPCSICAQVSEKWRLSVPRKWFQLFKWGATTTMMWLSRRYAKPQFYTRISSHPGFTPNEFAEKSRQLSPKSFKKAFCQPWPN